jgi:hypothetical protein
MNVHAYNLGKSDRKDRQRVDFLPSAISCDSGFSTLLEVIMRYLLSTLMLYAVTSSAWAVSITAPNTVPEPETLALLGVGVLAMLIGRKQKK